MLAVPAIYNQLVALTLRVRKYVQHMSLAHVIRRSVVVEVAGLAFFDFEIFCFHSSLFYSFTVQRCD